MSTRNCDSDCLHSKACNADHIEAMQDAGKACVGCGHVFGVSESFFGAGDGTGQSFHCESCHKDAERDIQWGNEGVQP